MGGNEAVAGRAVSGGRAIVGRGLAGPGAIAAGLRAVVSRWVAAVAQLGPSVLDK